MLGDRSERQAEDDGTVPQAMEIWLPDLPDIQLVQNFHRIPMNTTYWKNWPTAENDYVNGAPWHLTFPIVLWNLQQA